MRVFSGAATGICLMLVTGCAMFTSWQSIPPPGGCDQCHTLPIGNNWKVTYRAPELTDERDRLSFQTEEKTMPQSAKPSSSLELRKVAEQPCFDCHRSPDTKHKGRTGTYHH